MVPNPYEIDSTDHFITSFSQPNFRLDKYIKGKSKELNIARKSLGSLLVAGAYLTLNEKIGLKLQCEHNYEFMRLIYDPNFGTAKNKLRFTLGCYVNLAK